MKKFKYSNFGKKIFANFCTQNKSEKKNIFPNIFKMFSAKDDIENLCYNKEMLHKLRVKLFLHRKATLRMSMRK